MAHTRFREQKDYKQWNQKLQAEDHIPDPFGSRRTELPVEETEILNGLEQQEYAQTLEKVEDMLDEAPEYGWAYYYQLLATQKAANTAKLVEVLPKNYEKLLMYRRALRFADASMKAELNRLKELFQYHQLWSQAKAAMESGDWILVEDNCRKLKELVGSYRNSAVMLECAGVCIQRKNLTLEYEKRVGDGKTYVEREVKRRNPGLYNSYKASRNKAENIGYKNKKKLERGETKKQFACIAVAFVIQIVLCIGRMDMADSELAGVWAIALALTWEFGAVDFSVVRTIILTAVCFFGALIADEFGLYFKFGEVYLSFACVFTALVFLFYLRRFPNKRKEDKCYARVGDIVASQLKPLEDTIYRELKEQYEQYINPEDIIRIAIWR